MRRPFSQLALAAAAAVLVLAAPRFAAAQGTTTQKPPTTAPADKPVAADKAPTATDMDKNTAGKSVTDKATGAGAPGGAATPKKTGTHKAPPDKGKPATSAPDSLPKK